MSTYYFKYNFQKFLTGTIISFYSDEGNIWLTLLFKSNKTSDDNDSNQKNK